MALDIGTPNLPDIDATTPADPTIGREILNYLLPRPLLGTGFNLPKREQSKGLIVQLRSIVFKDALNGLSGILSSLITIENTADNIAVFATNTLRYFVGFDDSGTKRVAQAESAYDDTIDRWIPKGLFQMRVKSIQDDTLTCRAYDQNDEGELTEGTADITVQKPFKFRKSEFSGKTVEGVKYEYTTSDPHKREATATIEGEEQTITEEIIPKYTVDDIVYVAAVAGSPGFTNLIDINVDARSWAKTGTA